MCRNIGNGGRRADGQPVGGFCDGRHARNGSEAHQPLRRDDAILHLGQQVGAAAHGHRAGLGEEGDGFV